MNREAAIDAWILSLSEGSWKPVKYSSAEVPRVHDPALEVLQKLSVTFLSIAMASDPSYCPTILHPCM